MPNKNVYSILIGKSFTMSQTNIDRRVVRTRMALQHALKSLIIAQGYDATSVEDICEKANIGRSTFYGHYAGKEDLKRSGLSHLRETLEGMPREPCIPRLGFSLPLFEHARDHLDLYRALSKDSGANIALSTIRSIVASRVSGELKNSNHAGAAMEMPRDVAVQFIVGAFMGVLTWWLDGGAKSPPEEIDVVFRNLALRGIFTAG